MRNSLKISLRPTNLKSIKTTDTANKKMTNEVGMAHKTLVVMLTGAIPLTPSRGKYPDEARAWRAVNKMSQVKTVTVVMGKEEKNPSAIADRLLVILNDEPVVYVLLACGGINQPHHIWLMHEPGLPVVWCDLGGKVTSKQALMECDILAAIKETRPDIAVHKYTVIPKQECTTPLNTSFAPWIYHHEISLGLLDRFDQHANSHLLSGLQSRINDVWMELTAPRKRHITPKLEIVSKKLRVEEGVPEEIN